MTKLNANNNDDTNVARASNARRARKSRVVVVVRDIALKTILNDIIRDDKTRTLTTKQMRVVLRREYATSMQHAKNNAWTFDANEYVIVRSRFDAKYRAKNERSTQRATRKNAKSSNVETSNVDANA
jgi:hypothetical protein